MTCGICRRSQEDGFREFRCEGIDNVETCRTGEIPKLMPGNRAFAEFFNRVVYGLYDGWGALRVEVIETFLNIYGVPSGQRPVILDKCLALVIAINDVKGK